MRDILSSPIKYLQIPVPAPRPWRFDIPSALFGAAATLLLVMLGYVFRDKLRQAWEAIASSLARFRHSLQASTEERYRKQIATWARSLTVSAHIAPLDAVFIEPELLAPSPVPRSASEIEHIHPAPQVLPLHQVLGDHPQLLIAGTPGAGRSITLAHLALTCATTATEGKDRLAGGGIPESVRARLPLYVPFPVMDWEKSEKGEEGEEEEREKQQSNGVDKLLQSAVAAVGGSSGMASLLKQYLEAGQAIVLADGWDELSPEQRQQAATWLIELIGTLPGNLWLVGTGTRDYARLAEAGFIPLTLAPWDARQIEALAKRWVNAYTTADETPSISPHDLAAELQQAARAGAPPLELALRAFAVLSGHQLPKGRAALFDRVLDLLLWQEQEQEKKPWLSAACRSALGQIALALQQEKRAIAGREEIEAAIASALPPADERTAHATAHVFRILTGERGLFRPMGSNRYTFVHPLWQAYLAARQLVAVAPTNLVERLEDPQWSNTLRFYAELGDMGPLVAAWLRSPDDMFYTRLRTLSDWISVAPEDAAWRNGAMAILARTFLQTEPLAPIRQMLAKALAATGLPGVAYLFKQALQHPDTELRTAAALGLAGVAGEADLPIFEIPLEDEDPAVREAAVRGLASLGIDAARRRLEQVLLGEDDELKPVAAEMLIKCGKESVDLLRELAGSEDVMIRRAAVSGLAKAGARGLLEEMAREDTQWIVRSAAAAALEEIEGKEKVSGISPVPEIEQLPWLISWAATQGEGVGLGEAAQQMLRRALREGDDLVRLAAAQILIRIGRPDDVELLQATLADPDPVVASIALEALAEISRRYDLEIKQGE
jgi:HEAT repeat protein